MPDQEIMGYLIKTPSTEYNGMHLGVTFTNGRALIQGNADRNPEVERLIRLFRSDFGYMIVQLDEEGVDRLRVETATIAEQIAANLGKSASAPIPDIAAAMGVTKS